MEEAARWRDTFFPGALESWRVSGHVGGLPVSYACWTIFYNKALFRQHGWADALTDDYARRTAARLITLLGGKVQRT